MLENTEGAIKKWTIKINWQHMEKKLNEGKCIHLFLHALYITTKVCDFDSFYAFDTILCVKNMAGQIDRNSLLLKCFIFRYISLNKKRLNTPKGGNQNM